VCPLMCRSGCRWGKLLRNSILHLPPMASASFLALFFRESPNRGPTKIWLIMLLSYLTIANRRKECFLSPTSSLIFLIEIIFFADFFVPFLLQCFDGTSFGANLSCCSCDGGCHRRGCSCGSLGARHLQQREVVEFGWNPLFAKVRHQLDPSILPFRTAPLSLRTFS
jgi:hypothetical protein